MPVLTIKMAKGRNIEQKRELAQSLTDAVVRILEVRPEWVSFIIEEYERENWATGGRLHSDRFGTGCGTQGTAENE